VHDSVRRQQATPGKILGDAGEHYALRVRLGFEMKISSFFANVLDAPLANSRWSWGAFQRDTNRLFLRVWKDQIRTESDGKRYVRISRANRDYKSLGYPERLRHVDQLRKGAEAFGVVCVAVDETEGVARQIESFDIEHLIRFGPIVDRADGAFAAVLGELPVQEALRTRTSNSFLVSDLNSILRARVDQTTKEALVNARIGQGQFRADVLALWDGSCAVSGTCTREAIRASHIKPWRDSSNEERLDPYNGLPLVATLDALFDSGLIAFATTGDLLISNRLRQDERRILGLNALKLRRIPSGRSRDYLAWHRVQRFLDETGDR